MALTATARIGTPRSPNQPVTARAGFSDHLTRGTVTLVETLSSEAYLGQAFAGHLRAVHFQVPESVAVTCCQTAKRSVISVRHSGAESLCRLGRKCGEMPEKADRNRCACAGDLKRFIARSRCLVG